MRELPILFSTPMVQAIQADTKNQTRRTAGLEKVNENPDDWTFLDNMAKTEGVFKFYPKEGAIDKITECKPRYQKGDKIWVKETYYSYGFWTKTGEKTKTGKDEIEFLDISLSGANGNKKFPIKYHDNKPELVQDTITLGEQNWFKRPSLFMPKVITRTWLEVISVRCERLKDISEANAIHEGVESWNSPVHKGKISYQDYLQPGKKDIDCPFISPITSFMTLWQKRNGEESWNQNPWVFIYDFKRIEKPLKNTM